MNSLFPTRTAIVVVAAPAKTEAPVEAAPVAQKKEKQTPRGFGSVYQRGRIWHVGYLHHGKWHRESSHSDNKADAERLLKERWKQIGKGRFIGPSEDRVTMDSLFDGLENDYTINRRRSLGSVRGFLKHLRDAFGGMKAVAVTEDRIERYKLARLAEKTQRGKRPIQPATVNRELAALRKAFRLAVRQRLIVEAPAITLLEENNIRQGFVEPRELEVVIEDLPEYLQDFTRFAYVSAWRRGEVRTLAWSDVNRDTQTILLRQEHSKNKEPRLLPLTGELSEIIERRWQARAIQNADGSTGLAEFVFHQGYGRPVGEFRKSWKSACKKAGMPGLLVHDLRRSGVRNMDRAGVGQAVGMKISGHKTLSVYQRYRIVSESDMRKAWERTQAANARNKERRVVPISKAKEGGR